MFFRLFFSFAFTPDKPKNMCITRLKFSISHSQTNTKHQKCKISSVFPTFSDQHEAATAAAEEKTREQVERSSFRHSNAVHCANNFFCINFVPLSVLLLPFKILISFYFGFSMLHRRPLPMLLMLSQWL